MKEKSEKNVCSKCGKMIEGEVYEFEGQIFCEDCLDEHTMICDVCGKRVWYDSTVRDSERTLCYNCYDRNYTTCEDCGRIIRLDDAYYFDDDDDEYAYCYNCYENK